MRVEPTEKIESFMIFDAPALDAVLVVLQDFGGGRGRVLIECYGDAWTTYFGNFGDGTLKDFLSGCGTNYLANRMLGQHHKRNKSHAAYLDRIVGAVKDAIRSQLGKKG